MVSESDLLALADGRRHRGHRATGPATAGDLMTRPAVTISPDDLVQTAARVMQSHRLQRLPAVDREGQLEGIASQAEHLEGVVAVRDRFTYPARSAPSFPSDPGL